MRRLSGLLALVSIDAIRALDDAPALQAEFGFGGDIAVGVIQQPDRQLNLGSGKDPSDETIADAGAPLEIGWRGSSYLDLPIRE